MLVDNCFIKDKFVYKLFIKRFELFLKLVVIFFDFVNYVNVRNCVSFALVLDAERLCTGFKVVYKDLGGIGLSSVGRN